MDQQHQHVAGAKIFQTEHFNLVVKRCVFCGEFYNAEGFPRTDIPQDPPKKEEIHDAQ